MKRGSEWQSLGAESLAAHQEQNGGQPPEVDLLVIGSGYGGAVTAARVAEAAAARGQRLSVVVLERGLEYLPGDFPRSTDELLGHVRFSGGSQAGISGWRDGLFDLRLGKDVSALVASGLGGGSLINAGVAERADPATLDDPAWPAAWRGQHARWDRLYRKAADTLGAEAWTGTGVDKEKAMGQLARRLPQAGTSRPVHLTITPPGTRDSPATLHGEPAQAPLRGCVECGDCFSGCNEGAKRTLGTSYLQRARALGVVFYTGATVLRLDRATPSQTATDPGQTAARWTVDWVFTQAKHLPARAQPFQVRARRVILAAGSFGSTEILLRSQRPGLRFSPQLGAGFSTNGDVIGAQYGLPEPVKAWADEATARKDRRSGPTITRMVEINRNASQESQRLVVQDLTVPAPLGWLYTELLTSLMLPQRWTRLRPASRSADPASVDTGPRSDLAHTLLLTSFGHDGAAGRLHLLPGADGTAHDGNLVVHWPGAGDAACFKTADQQLKQATGRSAAYWLRNPLWQATPDSPLLGEPGQRQTFTVHPLGGCRMADSMDKGVVDALGRVFDAGTHGSEPAPGSPQNLGDEWAAREDKRVHPGLHVLDGAIVPTSLGINPLLTITALVEGIVADCLPEWLGEPAAAVVLPQPNHPPQPLPAPVPRPWPVVFPVPEAWQVPRSDGQTVSAATGLKFSERMVGLLPPALQPGPSDKERLRLDLQVDFAPITDLQAFVQQPNKSLQLRGTLRLSACRWVPEAEDWQEGGSHSSSLVQGEVHWFSRPATGWPTRAWRTLRGWLQLRACADLIPQATQNSPANPPTQGKRPGRVWPFFKLLGHFGAPRQLVYSMHLDQPLDTTTASGTRLQLPAGTRLSGQKSLVYGPGGNPWVQLTEMPLLAHRPGETQALPLGTLRFDAMHMLGRHDLPLQLFRQANAVHGLRDSLSLLLFFGRVVFQQHFLNFRKPDHGPARPLRRLPWESTRPQDQALDFLCLDEVRAKPVPGKAPPPRLQLRRIRRRVPGPQGHGHPLLLLHGFGSGGVQYTHSDIPVPLALWLAHQGREVWVGELRTSIGLPSSEQQWSMDEIAQQDVPALVRAVQAHRHQKEGRPADEPIDVVAHCIGSAMFCMAVLAGQLDGCIRRAVLMQVGPAVHLPAGNRLRGLLGNRAQKMMVAGLVQSTVNGEPSEAEATLDRVLGTFPYLGEEDPLLPGERLRDASASLRLSSDPQHNIRLVNAMRSAGVFAQLFQWNNLLAKGKNGKPLPAQPLLDALPDLLGPCNLTTYQQTVHYAFARRLTNQDGEDNYVTTTRLRQHMGFPILFVQGMRNDVFSPRGTLESQQLLRRLRAGPDGPGEPVERLEVPGFGHLDCVVGLGAEAAVFARMLPFLDDPQGYAARQAPTVLPPAPPEWRAPCVGPWIGHSQLLADGGLQLQIGLKVDDQRLPPACLYTVWVVAGEPQPASLRAHTWLPTLPPGRVPRIEGQQTLTPLHSWPEGEAVLRLDLPAAWLPDPDDKRPHSIWVCSPAGDWPEAAMSATEFVNRWQRQRQQRPAQAARSGVDMPGDTVWLDPAWLAQARAGQAAETTALAFVLLSCRQSPLLLDRPLADRVFGQINHRLDTPPPGQTSPRHVLMVGDQVYADALAATGGADGTRLRFFDAHREAWTAPEQRRLMARRPVYMAVDDHEFRDDHHRQMQAQHTTEWQAAREAMWRYQYAAGPLGSQGSHTSQARQGANHTPPDHCWYSLVTQGVHSFIADTRNERSEGQRIDGSDSQLMGPHQFEAIRQWLALSRQSGRPRFLVLPTPFAPVFANAVQRPEQRLRSDDWQRFPASRQRLFELLLEDGAEHLVLLSGDYHCFADCLLQLRAPDGGEVSLRSVVTGGVYSPYPFANTEREELWAPSATLPELACGPWRWSYRIHGFSREAGYTLVTVDTQQQVGVQFEPVVPLSPAWPPAEL